MAKIAAAWQDFLRRVRRAMRAFEDERSETESAWTVTIRMTEDTLDGGWVAEILDMPGCMSQGETEQEAIDNVQKAFVEILSVRMEQQQGTARDPHQHSGQGEVRQVALPV